MTEPVIPRQATHATDHPAAHLTMNTVVHAAFRRTLARFDTALGAFPDGSQTRADELGRVWDFFDHELHVHHGFEEEYFWPALQETDADLSSLAELDGEHEAMRAALAEATTARHALVGDPTAARAATARASVATLTTVLLDHLAHEERDLEPISAAYMDAPSMKKALAQVKKAHFRSMGTTVEWLRDGATAEDVAGLHAEIPRPVASTFARLAGGRYRREIAPVWADQAVTPGAPTA
jgi:hemerythrin-like domain-containing protein